MAWLPEIALPLTLPSAARTERRWPKETIDHHDEAHPLMAGFVALAAGAIMPNVATAISTIFSKVNSALSSASTNG